MITKYLHMLYQLFVKLLFAYLPPSNLYFYQIFTYAPKVAKWTVGIKGLLDNPSAMPRESIDPWNNTVLTTWRMSAGIF